MASFRPITNFTSRVSNFSGQTNRANASDGVISGQSTGPKDSVYQEERVVEKPAKLASDGSEIEVYDYIIVGAGASGCTLASRLFKNGANNVLLLEMGLDKESLATEIENDDDAYTDSESTTNASWITTSESGKETITAMNQEFSKSSGAIGSITPTYTGGCSLGGGIESPLLWVRSDSDCMERMQKKSGSKIFKPEIIYPFHSVCETFTGTSEYLKQRGNNGPLQIIQDDTLSDTELASAFCDSVSGVAGLTRLYDYNTSEGNTCVSKHPQFLNEGKTLFKGMVKNLLDKRGSKGQKLNISAGSFVRRVLFVAGRAKKVEYEKGGEIKTAEAKKRIILCAGTRSCLILLRSGIGSYDVLGNMKITKVFNNPFVGKNLQTHLGPRLFIKTRNESIMETLDKMYKSGKNEIALAFHQGGYIGDEPLEDNKDTKNQRKWLITLGGISNVPFSVKQLLGLNDKNTIQIAGFDVNSESTGKMYLSEGHTGTYPAVDLNLYESKEDVKSLLHMYRFLYDIYVEMTNQISGNNNFELVWPCEGIFLDDDRTALFKAVLTVPNFSGHWCGTCPIAKSTIDQDQGRGVVDDELFSVFGVQNLSICDASILPCLPTGNTEPLVLSLTERLAKRILKE